MKIRSIASMMVYMQHIQISGHPLDINYKSNQATKLENEAVIPEV